MSTPREQLALLRSELARVLPPAVLLGVLGQPLAELDRVLALPGGELEVEALVFDQIEDLIEAVMHDAGWPAPSLGGAT